MTKARTFLVIAGKFHRRQAAKDNVTDMQRIADGFEDQRVFVHPGNEIAAGAAAECENQLVKTKTSISRQSLAADDPVGKVDICNPGHDKAAINMGGDHLAKWRHDMFGEHRRAHDLSKQRTECRVALLAN